ncbi:MAG: hypothetical protein MJ117_04290 [Lachnospiraceae bacterium]|nr:hypothetical protein [Lachnospiraceae bacterium]
MCNKKARKAIRRALLIVSVVIAVLAAGAGFIGATNCVDLDKYFWIDVVVFILATEYVFLFMYANGQFIDELMLEVYEEVFGHDYDE